MDTNARKYTYEDLLEISEFIKTKVPFRPYILIVFGSGLGSVAEILEDPVHLSYKDIPNFPVSTVQGHAGKLVFGKLAKVDIVCMMGRFHYYEGYSLQECTVPIRVMALLGVKTLFVTNAAGGVNPNYKTGDMMFIKDHINFLGFGGSNPLRGPNEPRFGQRFIPINKAYTKSIIDKAQIIVNNMGLSSNIHEGVYAMVGGPNYESIAEVKSLRTLGADAVGMSTVPEVLVAAHCGMAVFGLTLITNVCVASYDDDREPNHEEVLKAVQQRDQQLKQFFTELVASLIGC